MLWTARTKRPVLVTGEPARAHRTPTHARVSTPSPYSTLLPPPTHTHTHPPTELSSLVDTSHVLDSTVKRSIFYLEKARPRPDIERYSDRYMKQSEKPPIRSLIEGDAWQVCYPLPPSPGPLSWLKHRVGNRGGGGAPTLGAPFRFPSLRARVNTGLPSLPRTTTGVSRKSTDSLLASLRGPDAEVSLPPQRSAVFDTHGRSHQRQHTHSSPRTPSHKQTGFPRQASALCWQALRTWASSLDPFYLLLIPCLHNPLQALACSFISSHSAQKQGYPDELKLTAGKRGAGGASHAGVGVSGTKSKRVKAEPHKASAGAGGGARKGQNGKTTAPVVSVKDMKDIFASLEKLATGTDLDADDKDGEEGDKEKKAGSDAEAEEEKEVEEEEEEDMDDYVQNYYDDEYDALGSDSGGDDY